MLDHIQLIWDNCKEYNKEGHYFELAEKMEKVFKKMIKNYLPVVQYNYQPSKYFMDEEINMQTVQTQGIRKLMSK